jgi:hypothetical protein
MSFALIFIGLLLTVSAVRNTHVCLISTIKGDFTGPGNFLYWVAALVVLGAIGYSETLRPLSEGLLILILVALFLTRGRQGLFTNLTAALSSTTEGPQATVSSLVTNLTGGPDYNPPGRNFPI